MSFGQFGEKKPKFWPLTDIKTNFSYCLKLLRKIALDQEEQFSTNTW